MKNKLPARHSRMRVWATAAPLQLMILYVLAISAVAVAQAQAYKVLFQFRAGVDGSVPFAGLVSDPSGNLYGTTTSDGEFDSGVVFKLSPAGKETVLHSFSGVGGEGEYPNARLVRDAAGNLYGTTSQGGVYGGSCGGVGCGTVFKLDGAGRETVLHGFSGSPDGSGPYASLARDGAGNLYGTTIGGGQYGFGTVFEVDNNGSQTVLHSFNPNGVGGDGATPYGGLARDTAGNLYGTTIGGGQYEMGTVFKMDTTGTETVLYDFGSQSGDGQLPSGDLIRDAAGNLYGTTQYGGALGLGTVFKVDKNGNETILHSFAGVDGEYPFLAGLLRDAKGNLYGATDEGGAFSFGTVYKLDSTGKVTVLHSFTGKGGKIPYGTLILDKARNLYGTTSTGGAYGGGVIYRLTP
jgi:uncharacterized repeat protein (TIGR03803 family)